jgi:hypothetical protein
MFNQALYNQEKSLKFQMSSMEKTLLNPIIGAMSKPRPKTAVSYKNEFDTERGRSARSTKSEQITKYYKNMTERSAKIKMYKMNQKQLRNEISTNAGTCTTEKERENVTLTDTSAMMMEGSGGRGEYEEQRQKRFQVQMENVREKSKFDFSRNYATRKHSFKLATNSFNTKIEVFKP